MTERGGMRRRAALPALALLLAACQPASRPGAEPGQLPEDSTARPEAASNQRLYELDPQSSRIDILVRREGPLARLGHDHVIVASGSGGYLLLNADRSVESARLWLYPGRWQIDPPEARARYDLDTEPDAGDIEGTRRNLLTRVLDAGRWPVIAVETSGLEMSDEKTVTTLLIDIEGRRVSLPGQDFLLRTEDPLVTVSGTFSLRQTELGLEPFSVLGGGLRVADELTIAVRLQGRQD